MSFFDLFKKKKKEQPIEELKWNKMWDLWAEEKASSPYAELMTYESEINNGGHMQFFDNVSNTSDLPQVISRNSLCVETNKQINTIRSANITTQQNDIQITPNKSKGENWLIRVDVIKTVKAKIMVNKSA